LGVTQLTAGSVTVPAAVVEAVDGLDVAALAVGLDIEEAGQRVIQMLGTSALCLPGVQIIASSAQSGSVPLER